MPFTPAAQRTRSPPARYHPGARPGNRDGASDLESEGGRARARGPFVSYLLGSRRGRGGNPGPGRRPRVPAPPPFPAAPGLVCLSWGWGAGAGPAAGRRRAHEPRAGTGSREPGPRVGRASALGWGGEGGGGAGGGRCAGRRRGREE